MPHNPVSDIEHVVFTDHSIRRRPEALSSAPSATANLVPFEGGTPRARDLGLAYVMVGRREQNTLYLDRGFRLLQEAVAGGDRDPETLAYRPREKNSSAWHLESAHGMWSSPLSGGWGRNLASSVWHSAQFF